jgi:hypothetical protein
VPQGRPPLPAPLMREVRQRCGFGCVICGFPLYEYDHLLGWAKVKQHVASEITLLCDKHHKEKTNGWLPNDRVMQDHQNPFNRRTDVTPPYSLHYAGQRYEFNVGTVSFEGEDYGNGTVCHAIRIDGEPLLGVRLEDGHYLLNIKIYNSSGQLVLHVADSELVLNVNSWDIEIVGIRLIIREASRKILFDVRFVPPARVVVKRGRFLRNGVELFVTPGWCAILNNRAFFRNVGIKNCNAGLVLGNEPLGAGAAVKIGGIPREGWDRNSAIRFMRQVAADPNKTLPVFDELLSTTTLDGPGRR